MEGFSFSYIYAWFHFALPRRYRLPDDSPLAFPSSPLSRSRFFSLSPVAPWNKHKIKLDPRPTGISWIWREREREGSHDNNFNTDATAKNYRDDQISGTIYSLIGRGAGYERTFSLSLSFSVLEMCMEE